MTTASDSASVHGPIYVDGSAWVKLYVPEAHSDALNATLLKRRDLFVSDLGATEVASALGRAVREGRLDRVSARRLLRKLRQHLAAGVFQRLDLTPRVHLEAERLLLADHAIPLRAADALHVALASSADVATIVTYDPRLASAARVSALASISPGAAGG